MSKVLIIDDEETICRMLLYALARKGIDADIATNGRDGLEKFRREDFDIVITDMVMPDMDGNSIARHIRGSDKPDTPIVGISGTSWLFDANEFDRVFEKPFRLHSLVETIAKLCTTSCHAMA